MKAQIDSYPNRHEIRLALPEGVDWVEGGATIEEVRDEDGTLVELTACWAVAPDVDPKAWAKQEIKPLLKLARSEGKPVDEVAPKSSSVTL